MNRSPHKQRQPVSPAQPRTLGVRGGVLGAFAVTLVGASYLMNLEAEGPLEGLLVPELSATALPLDDVDQDGLPYLAEQLNGLSDTEVDTDFDTFSDVEELARGSDPTDATSVPDPTILQSVGHVSYATGGVLTYTTLVYAADGIDNPTFKWGFVVQEVGDELVNHAVAIPLSVVMQFSTFNYDEKPTGERLMILKTSVPIAIFTALFPFSNTAPLQLFSSISQPNQATEEELGDDFIDPMTTGATIYLVDTNVPVEARQSPQGVGNPQPVNGGPGVIYQPLVPPTDLGLEWVSGKICWKNTSLQGVIGVNRIYEVDSASCEPFDAYCHPVHCPGTGGGQLGLTDPAALVGG